MFNFPYIGRLFSKAKHHKTTSIKVNGKQRVFVSRPNSVGDNGVIYQIFVNKDYDSIHQWPQGRAFVKYYRRISLSNRQLIVDAGANIGASAVFFALNYENTTIFSIEPDRSNYEILQLNTRDLDCINFHGAVSDEDGEVCLLDPGRSDYGFMTSKNGSDGNVIGTVNAISLPSILAMPELKGCEPLILKVDIEGGEESLFSGDCDWLDSFPLVIVELHDWMLPFSGSTRNFIKAISNHDFDFLHHGENLFLFNRRILGSYRDL